MMCWGARLHRRYFLDAPRRSRRKISPYCFDKRAKDAAGASRSIEVMFPRKGILRGWGMGCVMDVD